MIVSADPHAPSRNKRRLGLGLGLCVSDTLPSTLSSSMCIDRKEHSCQYTDALVGGMIYLYLVWGRLVPCIVDLSILVLQYCSRESQSHGTPKGIQEYR